MIRFFIYLNFFQTRRGWCVHASERTRTLDNTIFYPSRARRCNRDRFAYTPRVCATRKDRAPRRVRGRRKTIVTCTRIKWWWQNFRNYDVFRFQTVGRNDIEKRKYKSTSTTRRVLGTTSIVFKADFSPLAEFVFRTIGLRLSLRINCRHTMMFTNEKLTDNSSKVCENICQRRWSFDTDAKYLKAKRSMSYFSLNRGCFKNLRYFIAGVCAISSKRQ